MWQGKPVKMNYTCQKKAINTQSGEYWLKGRNGERWKNVEGLTIDWTKRGQNV